MRPVYLLPFVLLTAACSKPAATPTTDSAPEASKVVESKMKPEDMAGAMAIPMYPGATAPDGMSSVPEKRDDGTTHYSMVLASTDPIDKISDWYSKETGLPSLQGTGGGKSIVGAMKNDTNLIITIANEAGRNLIRIRAIVPSKR